MAVWIPTVLVLFAVLPSRRAVIVTFVAAWLFLPMASYELPFLPGYSKMTATCAGVFLSTLIFDVKRVVRFKPSWHDLPMALFCVSPFVSSLLNGLGAYDGASEVVRNTIIWATPYFIGRIYFNDSRGLRELALGIFLGGLLYVPLCLFEVRMSPKLHNMIYGFAPRMVQVRFGGWRPSVFMDGGLQVAMWMAAASLVGVWLWKTGALRHVWGVSAIWLVAAVFVTTVLCRSTGAFALLLLGLMVMWTTWRMNSRLALVGLLLVAPLYVALRSTAVWDGEPVVALARMIGSDRAESLKFRLDNEDILAAKAFEQPWFGWGSWGRNRVYDEWGRDISITDGLWIIKFGQHGFAGLISWLAVMTMPLGLVTSRYLARQSTSAYFAPALSLAVLVTLYSIDCLVNAMINPVFMLAGGGVVSFALVSHDAYEWATRGDSNAAPDNMRAGSIVPRRLYPS